MFKDTKFDLDLILSQSPHDANEDREGGVVLVMGPPGGNMVGMNLALLAFIEKMMTNPTVH